MLDENLPTFFLKRPQNSSRHVEAFFFTQYGAEPEATYSLQHANEKNTFAAALFDAHVPDVLYAEVLAKPGWTLPTLSQDEIRKNGGVSPPPQPIFPTEFAIQLYNPDQQVMVRQQTAKWTGTITYEFSMPQTTFRAPSASTLDRSQHSPAADAATPMINFVWRKEGRIGKDMTCYMTGKSTDPTGKKAKKSKEPDIAVAMFSGLKEMTIMEPNMYRVEMEDVKGLEVVLLLGAAVIRDLFLVNPHESFNISDAGGRKNSGPLRGRKASTPTLAANVTPPVLTPQPLKQSPTAVQQPFPPAKAAAVRGLYSQPAAINEKYGAPPAMNTDSPPAPPPRLDPRAQWEIDAETARLKAQVEAEAKRQEELKRKARRKAEEEEERKTREFLEQEERQRKREDKERRRREAEADKETERLRKQFGDQSRLLPPSRPQQRYSAPVLQPPGGQGYRPAASQSTFFGHAAPRPQGPPQMKKKSFWGLRSLSEQSTKTLRKKQSNMF